jgi:hypothetical protein
LATFHNEIHPRENNLILIPSGQTNKIIFLLGKHHLIMYNVPDSDYPVEGGAMVAGFFPLK